VSALLLELFSAVIAGDPLLFSVSCYGDSSFLSAFWTQRHDYNVAPQLSQVSVSFDSFSLSALSTVLACVRHLEHSGMLERLTTVVAFLFAFVFTGCGGCAASSAFWAERHV